MIPAQRQQHIIALIKSEGHVQVNALAKKFGVSELTIRRDLKLLADRGLLSRRFGGAVLERSLTLESDYSLKVEEFKEEKQAIGRRAVDFVDDGDTVCVNGGSTAICVIESLLKSNKKVTIITNNIDAVKFSMEDENASIIFTGGLFRSKSRSMCGSFSIPLLQNIWVNKSFISVDGFSLKHGLTLQVAEEALTTRTMIERTTGKVLVIADSSKIDAVGNYKAVDTDLVHAIITDPVGAMMLENQTGAPEIIVAE